MAWLEASCARQHVPLVIEDSHVLDQVCVLLGGGTAGWAAQAKRAVSRRPAASQPPDRLNAGDVQSPGSEPSGGYDGMVQDTANNVALPQERQPVPRPRHGVA